MTQNLYVNKFNETTLTLYPVRSNLIDLVSQILDTIRNQKYFLHRGVQSFLDDENVEEISGETLLTNYIDEFKVSAGHPKGDYGQTVTITFRMDGGKSPAGQFTMNSQNKGIVMKKNPSRPVGKLTLLPDSIQWEDNPVMVRGKFTFIDEGNNYWTTDNIPCFRFDLEPYYLPQFQV